MIDVIDIGSLLEHIWVKYDTLDHMALNLQTSLLFLIFLVFLLFVQDETVKEYLLILNYSTHATFLDQLTIRI